MLTANTTQLIDSEDDFIVLDEDDFFEVSGGNVDPLGGDSRSGGGAVAGSRVPVKSAS
jgi:hypothetical protein